MAGEGRIQHNRRLQDGIESNDPRHRLNLDRRVKGSDRRLDIDPYYTGPFRRLNVDRRVNTRDRRCSEQASL